MIRSQDRSYFIGASDTSFVVGNWETKTFEKWYGTKQGLYSSDFKNDEMRAGTNYEHKIIDALGIKGVQKDKQIIDGRLRVNLDANTDSTIYEIKTYHFEKGFKIPKTYIRQVNVEMYATGIRKAYIVSYGLMDEDYRNYYRDIDMDRISYHEIVYDEDFIEKEYKPKLKFISKCLDDGRFPKKEDFEKWILEESYVV